jgi:hypothetical protein
MGFFFTRHVLIFDLLQVFLYNATIEFFYKPNFWFAIVVNHGYMCYLKKNSKTGSHVKDLANFKFCFILFRFHITSFDYSPPI